MALKERLIINGPRHVDFNLHLGGSKSIANRLGALQVLFGKRIHLQNPGNSRDVEIMQAHFPLNELEEINAELAGTAYRFLLAAAIGNAWKGKVTGFSRMQERPIKPLVDALNHLGAGISYLGKPGYPPVQLKGDRIQGGRVEIDSGVSSQFISALMLLGPFLKKGLHIVLLGKPVSTSYIELTQKVLQDFGADIKFSENEIHIQPGISFKPDYEVESDWSSLAYWFSILACAEEGKLKVSNFYSNSKQADAALISLASALGIRYDFQEKGRLFLSKSGPIQMPSEIDGINFPDLIMALAPLASLNPYPVKFTGLDNLNLKESNRIEALATELPKIGAEVESGGNWLKVFPSGRFLDRPQIQTYDDHRMAMGFAPLSMKIPSIEIQDPWVVKKSYPDFWKDLALAGFQLDFTS